MAGEQGYDYLVVGAGSAGCVLANRLSADSSARVALIEAGGEPVDPAIRDPAAWPSLAGSAIDWAFVTVPQGVCPGRAHDWPRGRAVGGSSCMNAMAHIRGHPEDFDAWAAAGCTGWGFADILPYALRSEHSPHGPSPWHGSGGPLHLIRPEHPHPITQAFMAAAEERGLAPTRDHNGPVMTGPTLNTLTIRGGQRQTVADAYLAPDVRARPNLTILTERIVQRLAFGPAGRCTGVVVAGVAGLEETVHADAIVLAAGTIGSPVLLLRSGIGPSDNLRALGIACRQHLAGVGRNLHDHLLAGGNLYRSSRPFPPSRYQHSESVTYIAGEAAEGVAPAFAVVCVIAPSVSQAFTPPAPDSAYTLKFGYTHPRSRGSVRLASADLRRPPLIDPGYLTDERDRTGQLQALDWARAIGGAAALADWRAEELLPSPADMATAESRRDFAERSASTHHHPVGTCRMGTDPEAVVGPDLTVHGVEGLYVADASVFPSITTGPINAAVVAVAERASDVIAGRATLPPADPRRDPTGGAEPSP